MQTLRNSLSTLPLTCRTATAVRRRFPTVAFRPAKAPTQTQPERQDEDLSATVLLPLDFYACLSVTRTAGSRTVRDALDKALLQRPEAFYSADTVALRDLLLRSAAECLLSHDRRKEYDAKALGANGYVVSVSLDHLPGALVLLQESGCNQLVLELGAQWLADNRQDARCQDVAAVMALAHHALAVQGLQQDSSSVLEACRHLESALALLRQSICSSEDAVNAADLQRDALQLLKEYSPDYCLALLSLPLDDPQRQRGHVLLRKLLTELPDELSPLGADKDDFIAAARPLMSAHEHLEVYAAARHQILQQRQLLAEATVAVAFQQRRPLLLLKASRAFQQLEQVAAQEGAEVDMCVEHACIALLLGNTSQALTHLGLAVQQHASSTTQQAAQQYVLAHCPDSTDLLPGVYALAQCWMQQGILGSFRECVGAVEPYAEEEQPPAGDIGLDLSPWYDALRVRLLCLVLALLTKISQCVQACLGAPAAVLARLTGTQQQQQQVMPAADTSHHHTTHARLDTGGVDDGGAFHTPPGGANTSSRHTGTGTVSSTAVARGRRSPAWAPPAELQAGGSAPAVPQQPAAGTSATQQQQTRQQRGRQQQAVTWQESAPGLPPHEATTQATASSKAALQEHGQQQQQDTRKDTGVSGRQRRQEGSIAGAAGLHKGAAATASHKAVSASVDAEVDDSNHVPSLVARARAAGAGSKQHQAVIGMGGSMDEEPVPEPSPAVRRRLSKQMLSLEAQMWDTAPEPPGWRAAVAKMLPVLLVGAAVLSAVAVRQQQPAANLPPGAKTLLIDARG